MSHRLFSCRGLHTAHCSRSKKIRVVLLIVSLNWVYCKFDYASHVKEQFTFDSFNNKHFLEPLHHFLNTIFLFSVRPIPTLRRYPL